MISVITTIKAESGLIIRSRTVGYTNSFTEAVKIANSNAGDIYECGYYNYLVIEDIKEGLYQYDTNPKWFKWDSKRQGFYASEKPNVPDYIPYCSIG